MVRLTEQQKMFIGNGCLLKAIVLRSVGRNTAFSGPRTRWHRITLRWWNPFGCITSGIGSVPKCDPVSPTSPKQPRCLHIFASILAWQDPSLTRPGLLYMLRSKLDLVTQMYSSHLSSYEPVPPGKHIQSWKEMQKKLRASMLQPSPVSTITRNQAIWVKSFVMHWHNHMGCSSWKRSQDPRVLSAQTSHHWLYTSLICV